MKGGRRKETNSESGARRRIFGDGLRSMGSARVGYPMHLADGTLHQSVPCAKRIRQPTRAEPMEHSTPTKILRLAPDFVFVSFLCPL